MDEIQRLINENDLILSNWKKDFDALMEARIVLGRLRDATARMLARYEPDNEDYAALEKAFDASQPVSVHIWTFQRPREPGWYWCRNIVCTKFAFDDLAPQVVQLAQSPHGSLYIVGEEDRTGHYIKDLEAEWAGPLTIPT